jgi:hypothetical protein
MACSPEGHSRAWWTPIWRKTGLPSRRLSTFVVISTPSTVRPSHVSWGRVIGRTRPGFSSTSFFRSSE